MEQTRLLLVSARTDYSQALNVLCLIEMRMIPTTIEDLIYAYMVAMDWCEWIKNPESSEDSPLYGKEADDYKPMLDMFESYADRLSAQLCVEEYRIEAYLETLNPNLTNLWRGKNPVLKENTRLLYRSLRYMAQMFEELLSDNHFNKILEEKDVPPMSKLRNHLS